MFVTDDIATLRNECTVSGSVVDIVIAKGLIATIDISDVRVIAPYRWNATRGIKDNTHYAQTHIGGRAVRLHRLILDFPKSHIDHRDGNGLNNCRSNLRVCSHSENQANNRPRLGCTSRFKGVYRSGNRWIAKIRVTKGVGQKHLGSYASESVAANAYNHAAQVVYGEFARLNEVEEVSMRDMPQNFREKFNDIIRAT